MDPTSWSAYSQHLSRLGAINHPSGALSQQAQMNDLALSSSLQRQEHIAGYGNTGGPHPFLLAASHGLNPSQTNHSDPSFNANLFANYDASLFSSSFPPGNKGHLTFPQGAAGLFKAVNRENEFSDLRTGFSHCGMSAYSRNSDANNGLPSGSGHLFPNSMPPGSWRHSGIIPSSCGPFGVLPHETVLQRSHLVGRASDKLSVQASKQARASLQNASFVEQDLSRGYRTILSSPARPPSSFVDGSNTSHSSLLSPQNDPFFSSVNENFYSSCSKNDFAAYSSYCSNVQSGVQRSSISPYCYSQAFANFEPNADKQDAPTTSTNSSANANFSNFVPNSSLNGNPSHLPNGQISRQSVITSNVSNNSMIFDSESHQQNPSYNIKEPYPYQPGSAHTNSCASHPSTNSSSSSGGGGGSTSSRQAAAAHNSHHSSGQSVYPPMSTPIPASTPAHTTPPSSMGQAYVPIPLPMSHDSGCSSVNSQSVMYHSPSNDGCYSTPGTCPSDSGSPAKQDMSQHSSPSVYSIESSNLSMNSGPFLDGHPVRAHTNSDGNFTKSSVTNGGLSSDIQDNTSDSAKLIEEKLQDVSRRLIATCPTQSKDMQLASMIPLDMVKVSKENSYQSVNPQTVINLPAHEKRVNPLPSRSGCSMGNKNELFALSDTTSVLDFTPKLNVKSKRGHKRKCNQNGNPLPLNCTYSHLQNSQQHSPSPDSLDKERTGKLSESDNEFENSIVTSDMPNVSNSSPLPVDLSQVTMNLSIKKSESSLNSEKKENMFELNYDSIDTSSEKWVVKKSIAPENEKVENIDTAENLSRDSDIKKINKCQSPICRTPPLDDLSDESKKLCNSIEDDLGFLAGLSSDPDVEDSASKGSFSEKKSKKDQGFLQSFLTFLESSNEPPPVSTDPVNLERKSDKPESSETQSKSEEKKNDVSVDKVEDSKSGLIDQHDDKDNFDEAPSLDPTLFGCTTLQKEMVVPNPEAPSFSSDEDENSTQGIFDSVAMAIQRLCEDNEDDHNEKIKSVTPKCSSSVDDPTIPANVIESTSTTEQITENAELPKEEKVEECTIKSACVVKTRKGKRRRARHLLVIKVKRTADKSPSSVKTVPDKPRSTRSSTKEVQILKTVQKDNLPRRSLKRKCKEKSVRKKNSAVARRKRRNCVKRKYAEETEEESVVTSTTKDEPVKKPVPEAKKAVLEEKPPSVKTEVTTPKKPKSMYRGRSRRRRRGATKRPLPCQPSETSTLEPDVFKATEEEAMSSNLVENTELSAPRKMAKSADYPEIQFKTGDFVTNIENKDIEKPPIWRIEGKNVLQLFEVVEGENTESILYRNTSSYSRWSPSSKHKYSKQPVRVIKSDDDTVIVELLKGTDVNEEKDTKDAASDIKDSASDIKDASDTKDTSDIKEIKDTKETKKAKDTSGSCDFTIHPQRENFEVYLQTLVSQVLDPDFIPEIIKENDDYFLSHLKAIEDITSAKKNTLHKCDKWNSQLLDSVMTYPYVSVSMRQEDDKTLCQVCNTSKIQFNVHFHGQIYNSLTLESIAEGQSHPVCDFNFPLCGSCVQTVSLYSRLHHHKFHFFQLGCKKVKDVKKGIEKPSHTVLEECLQDTEWVSQMFQDMLEMWNACDKYR